MKRVKQLIDSIKQDFDLLIDIGSDHAFVGIEALKSKKVKRVWNVESKIGPLKNSKSNFIKAGLEDKANFYISNGFMSIPLDIPPKSLAVIAGLGSREMLNILQQCCPFNLRHILLLPHNHPYLLRIWVEKNNWAIVDESYFEDHGKVYPILSLEKIEARVDKKVDKSEIYLGKREFLIKHLPCSHKYASHFFNKINKKPNEYLTIWESEFIDSFKKFKWPS